MMQDNQSFFIVLRHCLLNNIEPVEKNSKDNKININSREKFTKKNKFFINCL